MKFQSTLVHIKILLNIEFHAIFQISFWANAATKLTSNTITEKQIDRHALCKNIQIVLNTSKKCKSVQNWKSKIFMMPMLFPYVEHKRK